MKLEYKTLIDATNNSEIQYEYVRIWDPNESPGLKMKHLNFPVGMKENEINFLYKTIIENNLKSGFEIATGFGASAYGIGMAFKQTNGKLITMDAYIEEDIQDPNGYKAHLEYLNEKEPDGFKSVNQIIKVAGLENHVKAVIGFSPQDVKPTLEKESVKELDFVLIDGGHWDEAVIRDFDTIQPYLTDNAWVFLHDVHCLSYSLTHIRDRFGSNIITPPECRPPHGWNLSYVHK